MPWTVRSPVQLDPDLTWTLHIYVAVGGKKRCMGGKIQVIQSWSQSVPFYVEVSQTAQKC